MILAHRTAVVLTEDGNLSLDHLPFRAGQRVEVIVLPSPADDRDNPEFPLQGMVRSYERPTDPVADGDWGVLQ